MTLFTLVQRGLSAQVVRLNAAASNLANAGHVAGSAPAAYRPLRPVFAELVDRTTGVSTVEVRRLARSPEEPVRRHDPAHPAADADGFVWHARVNENAEMAEVMDASRQYRNLVEAMQTAKQLMLDTLRAR
ncbi:flagellar basal body rod protein FlgC [Erythrobacteraceae bacterium CFH 75059]|nr:flagellar basal body rod protein FlgC [Erythrobacteraceae bacterium CFH 75059]